LTADEAHTALIGRGRVWALVAIDQECTGGDRLWRRDYGSGHEGGGRVVPI